LVGFTKSATDELKEKGYMKNVDLTNRQEVLDAAVTYFNYLQSRNPNLTPAEVYTDKYWTQWKTREERQKKIDEFNKLIK